MAVDFLRSYGFDLQVEINKAFGKEDPSAKELPLAAPEPVFTLQSVRLATSPDRLHDVSMSPKTGRVTSIRPSTPAGKATDTNLSSIRSTDCLALPSLCHPHIHLDKPYLLSHPTTSHLAPKSGEFKEALFLTAESKKLYTPESLLERGNWLVADSVRAGVTHMRAFVEVDAVVKFMCLEAGIELRRLWAGRCEIQLCAFAQDPVMSGEHRHLNRELMEKAAAFEEIEVVGSTPYVESDDEHAKENINWVIRLAMKMNLNLDFHLDYNMDLDQPPLIFHVADELRRCEWQIHSKGKTVCIGHCSKLASMPNAEWVRLGRMLHGLPVYFVGLPTSDIFMMARPQAHERTKDRLRATLQVPSMIREAGVNAVLGVNNVGNAFTPQGSADPLSVASMGVGLYQAGTASDAEILYQCVSSRAKQAIGLGGGTVDLELKVGDEADMVLFGVPKEEEPPLYRRRKTVQEIVYDAGPYRQVIKAGRLIRMDGPPIPVRTSTLQDSAHGSASAATQSASAMRSSSGMSNSAPGS